MVFFTIFLVAALATSLFYINLLRIENAELDSKAKSYYLNLCAAESLESELYSTIDAMSKQLDAQSEYLQPCEEEALASGYSFDEEGNLVPYDAVADEFAHILDCTDDNCDCSQPLDALKWTVNATDAPTYDEDHV